MRAVLWRARRPVSLYGDCGRGSVLLWWRFDTLCTSGFVDDVMFSHSGLYMVRHGVLLSGKSISAAETDASIPTNVAQR